MFKRIFDIIVSIIGLIVLCPVFLFTAIAIWIMSPGPLLYKGIRTGLNNKPFKMYKFRTMVQNAEKIGGTSTAENDRRITPIGSVLRKYKLDELPQLINVLMGEMSIVGPRPEVEEYTSMYTEEEKEILKVRPGITDYSSIKFRNLNAILANGDDPDEYFRQIILPQKNKLRLEYARKNNLWIDMKIIFLTVISVVFKRKYVPDIIVKTETGVGV